MRLWKRKRGNQKTHQETEKAGGKIGSSKPERREKHRPSRKVDWGVDDLVTTIRATCPDCGDISMKDHDVTLRICLDNDQASFRFNCPTCKRLVLKNADATIVRLLSNTGVQREAWTLPLELSEPRPGGEQLNHDDVLSMHQLLLQEDWDADLYREGEST